MNQPVHTRSTARHLWLSALGMAATLATGGAALARVAGGCIGIGRRDVVMPVNPVGEQSGKTDMPGGSQTTPQAVPAFSFAEDATPRRPYPAGASSLSGA